MTQTLLCFDYGRKRIGVAVGQTLTGTATPVTTIAVFRGTPDWTSTDKLIKEWQPDALVVGKPLNMDGSGQAMTRASNRYARELEQRYPLTVYRADERLSSYEAKLRLRDSYDIDAVAAQAILETWLSENPEPSRKDDIINSI